MNKMKGNAGRGKRIAAITAAILTFTGVADLLTNYLYSRFLTCEFNQIFKK